MKKAYRASLLRFDDAGLPVFDEDGLLVVGPDIAGRQRVLDAGSHAAVSPRHPDAAVTHLPGRILAPGFVDMHIHFPQTDIIGAPSPGLLPWLENYTFPAEAKFADPAHSNEVADVFFDELLRNGVTTSLTFATSHVASVDAFFEGVMVMVDDATIRRRRLGLLDAVRQTFLRIADFSALPSAPGQKSV